MMQFIMHHLNKMQIGALNTDFAIQRFNGLAHPGQRESDWQKIMAGRSNFA